MLLQMAKGQFVKQNRWSAKSCKQYEWGRYLRQVEGGGGP